MSPTPNDVERSLTQALEPYLKTRNNLDALVKHFVSYPSSITGILNSFESMSLIKFQKELERRLEQAATTLRRSSRLNYTLPAATRKEAVITRDDIPVIAEELARILLDKSKRKRTGKEKIILFFNDSDELFREPKKKYCYSFRGERMREKIFKALDYSFKKAEDIANEVGTESMDSIRRAISKINAKIRVSLNLKVNFIEGKQGRGYRINPAYVIKRI